MSKKQKILIPRIIKNFSKTTDFVVGNALYVLYAL